MGSKRLVLAAVALGLFQSADASAETFDRQGWSQVCQRALGQLETDACEVTETYIRFACESAAETSSSTAEARRDIEARLCRICDIEEGLEAVRAPVSSAPVGCVVTTACVDGAGLGDDCWELTQLRAFRDRHFTRRAALRQSLAAYYRLSPAILGCLERNPVRSKLFGRVYLKTILPCAVLAALRCDRACHALYRRGMRSLLAAAVIG